jgi:hypothetical protein
MLTITCCLFFKYRILNKYVILMKENMSLVGIFLSASQLLHIVFGYLIFKHLKGRRFLLQIILIIIVFIADVVYMLTYAILDDGKDRNFFNFNSTF